MFYQRGLVHFSEDKISKYENKIFKNICKDIIEIKYVESY